MRFSEKRRQAIFHAVHEEILKLRLNLNERGDYNAQLDYLITQAGTQVGKAAIKAAEGGSDEPKR